jgi:hypothetical protein
MGVVSHKSYVDIKTFNSLSIVRVFICLFVICEKITFQNHYKLIMQLCKYAALSNQIKLNQIKSKRSKLIFYLIVSDGSSELKFLVMSK